MKYYYQTRIKFRKQMRGNNDFTWDKPCPELMDRFASSGNSQGQYFFQDLFVAQHIAKNNYQKLIDIGSRIDGYVAHVASFRDIEVFDIRPIRSNIKNIHFKQADIMNPQENMENYADAISCLHVIEHFGLGRYGDPIDYFGHIKGLDNIYRMLKKDGVFYFSTPISDRQRIKFNANRVFSLPYLSDLFRDKYELLEFAYIGDDDQLYTEIKLTPEFIQEFEQNEACGIFVLRKI